MVEIVEGEGTMILAVKPYQFVELETFLEALDSDAPIPKEKIKPGRGYSLVELRRDGRWKRSLGLFRTRQDARRHKRRVKLWAKEQRRQSRR